MTLGPWFKWVGTFEKLAYLRGGKLRLVRFGYNRKAPLGTWLSWTVSLNLIPFLFRTERHHSDYRLCVFGLEIHWRWMYGGYGS